MNFNYKKIVPHIVALIVFYILVALYFEPSFNGYTLHQGDVTSWKGMSKEVFDHRYANEYEDPKWTNSMFGGMPAYQITNKDDSNFLGWIFKAGKFGLKNGIGNILVAFIGFYILLVMLGVNPWLSIVGGVAFGFSTYNILILQAGHNTKLDAIGWMPAVLGAVLYIYRKNSNIILGGLLLSLFMGIEILANHVQITYYLGGLIGLVLIQKLIEAIIKSKFQVYFKKTLIVIVAMIIGVLCNFGKLYSTYQYSKQTIRGKSELVKQADKEKEAQAMKTKGRNGLDFDYITRWSLGKEETVSVFIANAKGGASGAMISKLDDLKGNQRLRNAIINNYQSGDRSRLMKTYWGDQPFTSGPVYMGITIFLLFIIGLVVDKSYFRWTVIFACVIYVMLAWGKNFEGFNRWIIEILPLYNKFRAVSMTMVIVQLLLPLVGIWGVHLIIKYKDEIEIKKIIIPIASLLVLLLIFLVTPESFFNFFSGAETSMMNMPNQSSEYLDGMDLLHDYRVDIFKDGVKRGLLLVFLVGFSIFVFLKYKLNSNLLILILGLIVLGDLWTTNLNYQNNDKDLKTKKYKHWQHEKKNKVPFKAGQADKFIANYEFSLNPEYKIKYVKAENVLKNHKKSQGEKLGLKPFERDELKFKVIRDNSHYRVLKLGDPFNDSGVSYFHKSIGGYHAAKLMRYQELIENVITKEMGIIQSSFSSQNLEIIQTSMQRAQVLNMLNMKYLIYNPDGQPIINKDANGFAWPVKDVIFVENPNEEIQKVGEINTKTQAVVDKRFQEQLASANNYGKDTAIVKLLGVKSNELNYNFQSNGDQILIFSDIYYADGWNAYIDDKLVDHFRANYVLRGLQVPAGKHSITFKFEPKSVSIGMFINSIFSLLVLVGIGFFIFKEIKKKNIKGIVDAS